MGKSSSYQVTWRSFLMHVVTRTFPSLYLREAPGTPRNEDSEPNRLLIPRRLPFFSLMGIDPTRPCLQPRKLD